MVESRRQFFQRMVSAAAGLGIYAIQSPLNLIAKTRSPNLPDRFYLFVYFGGGWDALLALDPRDPRRFTDENMSTTRIQPAYDRLPVGFQDRIDLGDGRFVGPYFGELARHFGDMAIVRGLTMETLTHEVGRRRFLTGRPPSGFLARGSSAGTWLASQQAAEEPIPNLAVRVESYNADLPTDASAVQTNSVADLRRALKVGEPRLSRAVSRQIDGLLSRVSECPTPQRSAAWRGAETSRRRAVDVASRELDALFDFGASTPEMSRIREIYGIVNAEVDSPEARGAMAVRALLSGVSRCVTVQVTGGLDTHFANWASDHGPRLMRGLNVVAHMIDELKSAEYAHTGSSWFDHTTIVGFSEFQRTALLNVRDGRDHSLTNSCFLAGADIKGGTIVGRSSDIGMNPVGIDPVTGEEDAEQEAPRPEHIWQALYELNGLTHEPDLRVPGLRAVIG